MTSKIEKAIRDAAGGLERPAPDLERALVARAESEGLLDVAYASVDSPSVPSRWPPRPPDWSGWHTRASRSQDEVLEELAAKLSPRVLEAPRGWTASGASWTSTSRAGARASTCRSTGRSRSGFTRAVLRATARIRYGKVGTYAAVAGEAGKPAGGEGGRERARARIRCPWSCPATACCGPAAHSAGTPEGSSARSSCCVSRAACPDGPAAGTPTIAPSRRGGRVAEGTRLLSEYRVHARSRVRIPPSPFRMRIAWLCHRPARVPSTRRGPLPCQAGAPNRRGRDVLPSSSAPLALAVRPTRAVWSRRTQAPRQAFAVLGFSISTTEVLRRCHSPSRSPLRCCRARPTSTATRWRRPRAVSAKRITSRLGAAQGSPARRYGCRAPRMVTSQSSSSRPTTSQRRSEPWPVRRSHSTSGSESTSRSARDGPRRGLPPPEQLLDFRL